MHPRNRHQSRYDLKALGESFPPLKAFILINKYGDESIDFANASAVKALNQAILKHFYHVEWDLPSEFLCPPIPGRADYIHAAADLIGVNTKNARVLDVGVGANLVYPIIGTKEYGWEFVGSDINPKAILNAKKIIDMNPSLSNIELRTQTNPDFIFKNIIKEKEHFNLTLCNPPFHASEAEALEGTERKWKNLGKHQKKPATLNFGGSSTELWTPGGEKAFVKKMIEESRLFATNCDWFTTLISKEENLNFVEKNLKSAGALDVRIINMTQGQKKSRIVAWTFVTRHK